MLVCTEMLESQDKRPALEELAHDLRGYVAATLHRELSLSRWQGIGIPMFLSQRYALQRGEVENRSCLFAIDNGPDVSTPGEIAKHIARLAEKFEGLTIYVASRMSSDQRARLIAAHVPFVVPGNQLYIPQLALDLREHYRARPKRESDQLSPVAQVLLFYGILFADRLTMSSTNRTPSSLATALHYSAMSVGRAFDELVDVDLASVSKRGRTKRIHFAADGRGLIEAARPRLRKPAKSSKYIRGRLIVPPMKVAGESALSNTTSMSPPPLPVYAMHANDWSTLSAAHELVIVDPLDRAEAVIEFWHYRPEVLTDYDVVDPLSLYAQFWDDPNERIAMTADEVLEHVSW